MLAAAIVLFVWGGIITGILLFLAGATGRSYEERQLDATFHSGGESYADIDPEGRSL